MSKLVILCVDDEKMVLDSLAIELRKAFGNQYLYEFAEDAEEGLEIIEDIENDSNEEIILIISDWLMPGMKGDDFLIKVHQKNSKIIKMMLTGQASEEAIEDAKKQANLFCCLRKPWQYDDLIDAIKRAIDSIGKN